MFEFLGKIAIGAFLGIVVGGIYHLLREDGVVIKGTQKYNNCHRNAKGRVKEILKNGTGSSKADLQNWWDSNHK
jgi:hypothetical protein